MNCQCKHEDYNKVPDLDQIQNNVTLIKYLSELGTCDIDYLGNGIGLSNPLIESIQ